MRGATIIVRIEIYRDRSRWLTWLSQSTYIDKVLKRFKIHDYMTQFIYVQHGLALRKYQFPSIMEELESMIEILYVSTMRSIM